MQNIDRLMGEVDIAQTAYNTAPNDDAALVAEEAMTALRVASYHARLALQWAATHQADQQALAGRDTPRRNRLRPIAAAAIAPESEEVLRARVERSYRVWQYHLGAADERAEAGRQFLGKIPQTTPPPSATTPQEDGSQPAPSNNGGGGARARASVRHV